MPQRKVSKIAVLSLLFSCLGIGALIWSNIIWPHGEAAGIWIMPSTAGLVLAIVAFVEIHRRKTESCGFILAILSFIFSFILLSGLMLLEFSAWNRNRWEKSKQLGVVHEKKNEDSGVEAKR
jgi:hypothetical protein